MSILTKKKPIVTDSSREFDYKVLSIGQSAAIVKMFSKISKYFISFIFFLEKMLNDSQSFNGFAKFINIVF